jgi:CRP-like cAMP-binding protein
LEAEQASGRSSLSDATIGFAQVTIFLRNYLNFAGTVLSSAPQKRVHHPSAGAPRLAFIGGPGYDREFMAFFTPKLPESLRKTSLFQDMDDATLSSLLPLLSSRKIKAGETVFREDEPSDALYIVENGRVVVSKNVSGQTDIVLARLSEGDFFGEMGLFDAAPRSASAHAEIDTTLWKLDRSVFHDILTNRPEIARICYHLVNVLSTLAVTGDQAREAAAESWKPPATRRDRTRTSSTARAPDRL